MSTEDNKALTRRFFQEFKTTKLFTVEEAASVLYLAEKPAIPGTREERARC